MDILSRIDLVLDEASKDDLRRMIKGGLDKKKTKGYIWNMVKRSFRNVNKKKFEKAWNEVSESTVAGDVAKNTAKGHVDLIGPRKKKRKSYMKRFRYMFPGIKEEGTFEVEARNLKTARNKIKREWGISSLPGNIRIWED